MTQTPSSSSSAGRPMTEEEGYCSLNFEVSNCGLPGKEWIEDWSAYVMKNNECSRRGELISTNDITLMDSCCNKFISRM